MILPVLGLSGVNKKCFPQPEYCELTGQPGWAHETRHCLLLWIPVSTTQESIEVSESQEMFITVRLLINSNWHLLRVALPSRRTGRSKQKQTGWDFTKCWRADRQTDVGELDWVKPRTVSVGRMKCLNTAAEVTCLMQMGGFSARVRPEGLQIMELPGLEFRCCLRCKALMLLNEHLIFKLKVKVLH